MQIAGWLFIKLSTEFMQLKNKLTWVENFDIENEYVLWSLPTKARF